MEGSNWLRTAIFFVFAFSSLNGVSAAATTENCTPCGSPPALSTDLTGPWKSYINARGVMKVTSRPNNCNTLNIVCKGSSSREIVTIAANKGRILTRSNGSVTYENIICDSEGKWVNKLDRKVIDSIHCVKNKPTTKTAKKTTTLLPTSTEKPAELESKATSPSSNECGPALAPTLSSTGPDGDMTFTYDNISCRKTVTIKCSSMDESMNLNAAIVVNDYNYLDYAPNTVSIKAEFVNQHWTAGSPGLQIKTVACVLRN